MKIGFIGWRGMVGSVLMDRIVTEKDFSPEEYVNIDFFSTSQVGEEISLFPEYKHTLKDAHNLKVLEEYDILISCQGGDYTKKIHPLLRSQGWTGYWIDAASALRLTPESTLILDPVNRHIIDRALNQGVKDFIGSNCTVSILLMAIGCLFQAGLVEWVSNTTYQAASGSGARNIVETIKQMKIIGDFGEKYNSGLDILSLEKQINTAMNASKFPVEQWGYPLAGNILPWVDTMVGKGQTREEYKSMVESHKIFGFEGEPTPIDGTCVRVAVLRCHSEGLTIKLKKNISLEELETMIRSAHSWVKWVPNDKDATLQELTPASISGSLQIGVGRVRKLLLGEDYLNVFCVGDQLLWGAAEPLRRMIKLILGHKLD